MKRTAYLKDPAVSGFIEWSADLLTGNWKLIHSWKSRGFNFSCETLYDAFQSYRWPTNVEWDEGSVEVTCTFDDTVRVFARLRDELHQSAADPEHFERTAIRVSKLGGIHKVDAIRDLKSKEDEEIRSNVDLLGPDVADTDELTWFRHMRSAYRRPYSLLVDGVHIVD